MNPGGRRSGGSATAARGELGWAAVGSTGVCGVMCVLRCRRAGLSWIANGEQAEWGEAKQPSGT